jgi:hypothetical protein
LLNLPGYVGYDSVKELLDMYLDERRDATVVEIGCGNSSFGAYRSAASPASD